MLLRLLLLHVFETFSGRSAREKPLCLVSLAKLATSVFSALYECLQTHWTPSAANLVLATCKILGNKQRIRTGLSPPRGSTY